MVKTLIDTINLLAQERKDETITINRLNKLLSKANKDIFWLKMQNQHMRTFMEFNGYNVAQVDAIVKDNNDDKGLYWQCESCTFVNSITLVKCCMCLTPQPKIMFIIENNVNERMSLSVDECT
eukprot:UN07501